MIYHITGCVQICLLKYSFDTAYT